MAVHFELYDPSVTDSPPIADRRAVMLQIGDEVRSQNWMVAARGRVTLERTVVYPADDRSLRDVTILGSLFCCERVAIGHDMSGNLDGGNLSRDWRIIEFFGIGVNKQAGGGCTNELSRTDRGLARDDS